MSVDTAPEAEKAHVSGEIHLIYTNAKDYMHVFLYVDDECKY